MNDIICKCDNKELFNYFCLLLFSEKGDIEIFLFNYNPFNYAYSY
jgi:hypothetical protein